jgi:imidazolonepropionase-like amidohydrolase
MPKSNSPVSSALSALAALAVWPAASLAAQQAPTPLAIAHVTIIDVASGDRLPDRTVLVTNGKITTVGPSVSTSIPNGYRLVDGTRGFLVPGLWDSHVHLAVGTTSDTALVPLFLANGITSVREMGAEPRYLGWIQQWRKAVASGRSNWPRIVSVGAMIDGKRPEPADWAWVTSDSASGAAMVDSVRAGHYDAVKLQDWVTPEAFRGIVAAAHAAHLPLVGHAPFSVGVAQAADAGYLTLEHLGNDYVAGMLVDCSSIEDSLRASFLTSERALDEKAMQSARNAFWIDRLLETQDHARCEALARRLADRGVWQTPTIWLSLWFPVFRADSLVVPEDRLKFYPRSRRPAGGLQKFRGDQPTADDKAANVRLYRAQLDLIALLHRTGSRFLAGSDTGPWNRMLPGFSLHDELARLAAAGFSPLEVLQAATINPARAFGLADQVGAIRAGQSGDLLLLDADPLLDVGNLQRIRAVVVRGRLVDARERASLLSAVAAVTDQM